MRPPIDLDDGVVALRAWRDGDVDQITQACQDAAIQRFIPVPAPYRRADAVAYVERTRQQWADGSKAAFAIVDAPIGDTVLGAINVAISGASGNAAYWVAPAVRRRGMATRALELLTTWAMGSLGLGVIILEISPENPASQRVARAAGYHEAGHLDFNQSTGQRDHLIYSRLVTDPPVPA